MTKGKVNSKDELDVSTSEIIILQRLETFAQLSPNAIAVEYQKQKLTYFQLNQKINRLANFLIQLDVKEDVRVCTLFEPSLEAIVVLLAIFKVGATYVPIDPEFPLARIDLLIKQVKAKIILHQQSLRHLISDTEIELLSFDLSSCLGEMSDENPNVKVAPESTATLFFTSGTTGTPKGVMASYNNVSHYINVANTRFQYANTDIIPAIARLTFSISIFELLSPIFAGATLVLLPRATILDLNEMSHLLKRVTAIHMGPSLLSVLVQFIQSQNQKNQDRGLPLLSYDNLRHISSGGDMVPVELLRELQKIFLSAEIYVIYGCSEISCMGVTHFYRLDETINKSLVGFAFDDVAVYLLDDNLSPVPQGCIGNVYFSGNGVTKGYFEQPNLTQKKYLAVDGLRYYDTGDRGRFNSEGALEFLGRKDFQIQVHGIRIELGEIEGILKQLPMVKEGVIAQKELADGKKKIIAYVIKNQLSDQIDKSVITESILLEDLSKLLPDYMIPDHIYFMDKFPLNHNFKLDRKALPLPTIKNTKSLNFKSNTKEKNEIKRYLLSQTEITLCEIWKSALNLDEIRTDDNYFQLGGDSLSLALCVASTHTQWAHNVLLSELFTQPSIGSWAKAIDKNLTSSENSQSPKLLKSSSIETLSNHESLEQRSLIRQASYQQQQFWYLYCSRPTSSANNIPFAYKVSEAFQVERFIHSIEILLQQYEILRTQFIMSSNGLELRVEPNIKLVIEKLSKSIVDDGKYSENEIYKRLEEAKQESFDLEAGELFKVKVLTLNNGQFIVFMAFHHIAIDQRSITQFGEQLQNIYTGLCKNKNYQVSTLEYEYFDYSLWQNKLLTQDYVKQQQKFWRKQLQDVEPTLNFPLDRPRSESDVGEEILFELEPELVERLDNFSKNNSVTVYTLLLAIFSTLLYRHTGQSKIVLGTPFANRDQLPELQNIMGCFINMLPIVTCFDDCLSFSDLLEQLQDKLNVIRDHQNISLQSILEASDSERGIHYNPIYQVGLSFQEAPLELILDGVDTEVLELKANASQLDFTFKFWRHSKGIAANLIYNQSIFNHETMSGLVDRFQFLSNKLLSHPKINLKNIDYLSDSEKLQMKVWNQTEVELPVKETLLDKFDQQVKQKPNNIALNFENESISYQQLFDRSNQLANYLVEQGILPGDYVGLHFFRSIEMIIAVYAVIRVGGAYVPIEPDYPESRKFFIVNDADVKMILSHQAVTTIAKTGIHQIMIDKSVLSIKSAPKHKPVQVNSQNDCYVIYTSGSTGVPKGVATTHISLLNSLFWMQNTFKLTKTDSTLLKTSFIFDVSVWEIFWSLRVGGRLVIAKPQGHLDTHYIKQLIFDHQISFLNFVPSMLQEFLQNQDLKDCESLRFVLSGGESLSSSLNMLFHQKSNAVLYNGYGPTETAICVSLWRCSPTIFNKALDDQLINTSEIPIGYAVSNTQFFILDEHNLPVALGTIGELCIGGLQVAKGYLNRIELSNEKFIQIEIDNQSVKLYKTGDLVRLLPNGALLFIGRRDSQVKIRGLRIELGEIEETLALYPAIQQVVCLIKSTDEPMSKNITAFYLGYEKDSSRKIDTQELKLFLSQHLPLYMIPQSFIKINSFPMLASGKINSNKLFEIYDTSDKKVIVNDGKENITEMQARIMSIWCEALSIDSINVHDNFFDIGGNSLLSIQIINNIETEIGVKLEARALVMESLAQLASHCETSQLSANVTSDLYPIVRVFRWVKSFLS